MNTELVAATGGRRIRVVVDTCVLLDGALDPASTAAKLPALRTAGVTFVVCRWCLDEASAVVERESRGMGGKAEVAEMLIGDFANRLSPLVVDDGGTWTPRNRDLHAIDSIAATGADLLVTRNLADFEGHAAISPSGLLRRLNFEDHSIEVPWSQPSLHGTVALSCVCWPGESFGWMMLGENGERIGLGTDGRALVEDVRPVRLTRLGQVPHGKSVTISGRVKAGLDIDIDYVVRNDLRNRRCVATMRLSEPVRFLPFGPYHPGGGWNMECTWLGAIPRYVRNRALRFVFAHETTEAVSSGLSVRRAIEELLVLEDRVEGGYRLVHVGLPRSSNTRHLRRPTGSAR